MLGTHNWLWSRRRGLEFYVHSYISNSRKRLNCHFQPDAHTDADSCSHTDSYPNPDANTHSHSDSYSNADSCDSHNNANQ